MAALRSPSYDLALLDAVEERIRSVVENGNAKRELVAALQAGIPTRVGLARVRVDAAASRNAASRSSLEAAVAIEAEARA